MITEDSLGDREQELLGETKEDIDSALCYRDKFLESQNVGSDEARNIAPPTLDGVALLFSRYGLRNTPMFRVIDTICVEWVIFYICLVE